MHLAHCLLPRVRRVLLVAIAPLLVVGLLVVSGGSALPAAAAGSGVDISAGGPAAAPYAADEDFTGGATAAVTNAISTTGVTDPAPQSVYQHNRYGNPSATRFPGSPRGELHRCGCIFGRRSTWTAAGSRISPFNVSDRRHPGALTNFDIFAAAGGEFKAVVEQFTEVAPSSGTFTIQFSTVKDNAQVNGIEIVPAGSSA